MVAVKQQLELNSGQQVVAVMSMEQALRQLELGRNKLAVLPKFEAEAMVKKLQLKNVQVVAPSLMVTSAYHYVHQKHQALVAPLSKVLSRLTGQQIEPERPPKYEACPDCGGSGDLRLAKIGQTNLRPSKFRKAG